jgi:hypothetical protein
MDQSLRIVLASLALVGAAAAAFVIGRTTANGASDARRSQSGDLVGRPGDVFRVPEVGLFCIVDFELDRSKVICNRETRPRFQVVFERNSTSIGRIGYPGDRRVFAERP